jgi:sensor histidine kinase YesM
MNKRILVSIEIICHILFWVIPTYFIIRYNLMNFEYLTGESFRMPLIVSVLINILVVYSNMFILFPAYSQKKINLIRYSFALIIILVLTILLKVKIDSLFVQHYFSKTADDITDRFLFEFIINSFFITQSVLYCIVKEWIKNKLIERKLIQEKLSLELKYLKSQINPHFLFNTLNNLYSVALKNNDNETATGITKLSNIMRFMLDDVNENLIPLDKEITYLQSYLDLQRLRFSEKDDIIISLDIHGDTANIKIPPFMFIVFIENAFKYGINYKKHSFINIQFVILNDSLRFYIKNSIHYTSELNNSGIGLKNVKDRLELLYPDSYNLEISNANNIFSVELGIRLSSKQ